MSTALLQIIANDKLTGDNYTKWKHNINAILVTKDLKFVLTEECPPMPAANAARTVREAYEKWVSSDEKARTYLLASMTDVLVTKHEAMGTAFEIMESLQAMFGQPSEQKRHEAVRSAMLARMKDGASVREHVLNMMSYFNTAEINGGAIDEPSQVSIILTTLPKSFDQFKSNYGMNKLKFSLTQLLNELTTFESLTKDSKGRTGEANVAEPSSSNNNKRKRFAGKAKGKPKPKKAQSKKKGASIDKSKGKCFHCDKVGHWKRNCPQYLEEVAKKKKTKGKYDLLVLESCLVEDDSSPWIVDSGATNHVCSSLQWTDSWTQLEEGAFSMRVGSGDVVSARAVGVIRLRFCNNNFILLDNVFFIPGFTRNLISVSKLLV